MAQRLSSKDITLDISSMRSFAYKLLGRGKDYDALLKVILEKDIYNDDDVKIPSIKELMERLNMPYSKVRRDLNEIYKDLENHKSLGIEFPIRKVEYCFSMRYFDNRGYFILDQLPVVPRIGEEIHLPYLRAKVGTEWFYVESVSHYLDDEKQSVHITLRPGSGNIYFRFAKDEALLKGRISHNEYFDSDDYDLREKLGLSKYLF